MAEFRDELRKHMALKDDDMELRERLAVGSHYGGLGEYIRTQGQERRGPGPMFFLSIWRSRSPSERKMSWRGLGMNSLLRYTSVLRKSQEASSIIAAENARRTPMLKNQGSWETPTRLALRPSTP
jgi:hypothetical protein